jgi:hypothetical protein
MGYLSPPQVHAGVLLRDELLGLVVEHLEHEQDVEEVDEEAINTPFCPLQEKFHAFVLRGLRNISEAP